MARYRKARQRSGSAWLGVGRRAIAVLLVAVSSAQAATVTYVYDEIGRLVGMTDTTGSTATYTYDPTGNITAIAVNAVTVAITNVAPSCGNAASSVTIAGSGFASTPSGNTVTFNGIAATVTQASATRLVVTVPSGSTNGAVVVTTAAGSATAAGGFHGSCAAPTITSVSPGMGMGAESGAAGTTVNITGTNFRSNPADDQVTFGVARAVVTTASATSLTLTVPEGAASGHVRLDTPFGTAMSPQDFFVLPAAYASGGLDSTVRTTIGTPITTAITTPGHAALVLFDGSEGQRVSVLGSPPGTWRLVLVGPYGSIEAKQPPCGSGLAFDRPTTLPGTGTYAVLIDDPNGVSTGSLTVTVSLVADEVRDNLFANFPTIENLNVPGQRVSLPFAGKTKRFFAVQITPNGAGLTCCNNTAAIIAPDGGFLHDPVKIDGGGFIDPRPVTVDGTYSLLIDPGPNTGSVIVKLLRLKADRSKRWRVGHHTSVSVHTPGQNALFTFDGTAGQKLDVERTFDDFPAGTLDVFIANPDGSPLVVPTRTPTVAAFTLPQTGTYSVVVDPIGASTGRAVLVLNDCSATGCQ